MSQRKNEIFERQGYHLLVWIVLGSLLYLASWRWPAEAAMRTWGWSASTWMLFSWIMAALHQGWVWFFWRLELHLGRISAWFGAAGFLLFRIGFVLFASTRFLALIPISHATADALALPTWLCWGLIVVTTPPILWGLYSVFAYFGLTRAFGADHFDPAYRGASLETRGIFRYVPNAMYTVVLLAIYHPGLLFQSRLGLIAAAAHHAFVWTHYFCTEKPDMKSIYGSR
jgi:hypothetical protein